MTITLPISKARENFPTLVDSASRLLNEYIITVKGYPAAVLISASEYEYWKETNEILDDKELMKSIRKGEADFKKGKWHDWEDVKRELKINV